MQLNVQQAHQLVVRIMSALERSAFERRWRPDAID
jgi:hypothetical protein